VVGLMLVVSDGPLVIRVAPWLGEEVIATMLSALESLSVSSSADGFATVGS
jgi:hypothetical protein